ncbi:hypothetical protein ZWY2020_044233 [Hordeum vulgare]|nr:hypothetical protein ZWY2020_044233 [Hordeum vulgare]
MHAQPGNLYINHGSTPVDCTPKEAEIRSRTEGGKMDQRIIIVCSVVGSIGVLSAILGFSAEGTKLTISDVYVGGGLCLYLQNPALGLGVCAAIFLIVAQIIFAAFGGCCGCCKSRAIPCETSRIIGVVCADGIFAGGAVLTLVATALGVTSSVMLRGQPAAAAAPPAVLKEGEQMSAAVAGIAMGQPQLPQQPPQWKGHGQAPNAHYPLLWHKVMERTQPTSSSSKSSSPLLHEATGSTRHEQV